MLHGACVGEPEHETLRFPCKVAAAGDEGYLLCAAGGLDRFEVNRFLHCVLQRVDANRNVMAAWMCAWCCKTHCNGCMNVAWGWFWGGSRSTKPRVFPCKVAAAGDERYLRPWLPFELGQPDMRAVQGCPRDRALLANLLETFLVCHLWV